MPANRLKKEGDLSETSRAEEDPPFGSAQATRRTHMGDAAELSLSRARVLLIFWHVVRRMDKLAENPGDRRGETPDQGG